MANTSLRSPHVNSGRPCPSPSSAASLRVAVAGDAENPRDGYHVVDGDGMPLLWFRWLGEAQDAITEAERREQSDTCTLDDGGVDPGPTLDDLEYRDANPVDPEWWRWVDRDAEYQDRHEARTVEDYFRARQQELAEDEMGRWGGYPG